LPKQKDVVGISEKRRHDHREKAVEPVYFPEEYVLGNDEGRTRDHHRSEDEAENCLLAAKIHTSERIGDQGAREQGPESVPDDEDECVAEVGAYLHPCQHGDIIVERRMCRYQLRRPSADADECLEGARENPNNGKEHDNRDDDRQD